MFTLGRILKYTPAVVVVLLMVAWLLTSFWQFGFNTRKSGSHDTHYNFLCHSIFVCRLNAPVLKPGWFRYSRPVQPNTAESPQLSYRRFELERGWEFRVPIVFAVSMLLPLAIGPFIAFRFRIWHYLAYTAIIAIELAYYLRWQE
jgi:hypothetical protein